MERNSDIVRRMDLGQFDLGQFCHAGLNQLPSAVSAGCAFARPRTEGKFLYLGEEKFFVRGVTYGAFPPNSQRCQFPESPDVVKDFALMRRAGINTILTYTVPPVSLLDQAQEHGIRVIVTTPWMEYACFLEGQSTRKEVREQVRRGVAACEHHPAVLMYCVGKEIPPAIVRWHGPKKVEAFLRDLYHVAKDEDSESLVTYTNFPTTEYLELAFADVFTFNVYLHRRRDLCAYLSRLQHLAGELPFVLTEFGMCSFRHGQEGQTDFLDWQIEEIFDHGAAGAVIFGWTDPFFQDGCLVEEWGFGLVDAERRPKASYEVARRRFTSSVPFSPLRQWPRVTVVVATYNAARTLDDCLSSLEKLRLSRLRGHRRQRRIDRWKRRHHRALPVPHDHHAEPGRQRGAQRGLTRSDRRDHRLHRLGRPSRS